MNFLSYQPHFLHHPLLFAPLKHHTKSVGILYSICLLKCEIETVYGDTTKNNFFPTFSPTLQCFWISIQLSESNFPSDEGNNKVFLFRKATKTITLFLFVFYIWKWFFILSVKCESGNEGDFFVNFVSNRIQNERVLEIKFTF